MTKAVTIGAKPRRKAESGDDWVSAGAEKPQIVKEPMKRLTIDVPEDLHRRLKVGCAQSGEKMADFVRRLLEQNVP